MRAGRAFGILTFVLLFACEPAPDAPDAGPIEGDGAIDDGAIDDGAIDDDGGTVDAGPPVDGGPPPGCGNGVVDPGEACDDGEANSDVDPDACRTRCVLPSCGDGVADEGEACDEGAMNGDAPGACRAGCRLAWCGDGVVDPGEACDEGAGNGEGPGACRSWCEPARCGDGVVDPGELCDDGFDNSDRVAGACRTTCTLASCGDGTLDGAEQCDEGAAASDVRPDACRTTCVRASCGDGVVDRGEECDDGAANSDTAPLGCRTSCRLPYCGDGVLRKDTERCDQGAANSLEPGACRPDCTPPRCGDGIVDPREECDDANAVETDGCDTTCRSLTCPPARPTSCYPGTTTVPSSGGQTICQVLNASTSIAAYRAHPGIQALNVTLTNASADACIEHYLPTCSPTCPCLDLERGYPIELCEVLDSRFLTTICRNEIARGCADVVASTCPTATRALCADEVFRTQVGRGGIPACARYLESQCETIAAAECPALDLTVCGAWARDRSSYPADCGWWAAERCPTILSTCPTRSLERCATLDTLAPTLHPVCAERLTVACVAWEDRYCPTNIIGRPPVNADNCLRELDVLRADRFPECHPWLDETCERLVTEHLQDHLATTELCRTHIARTGEGYDYDVEEGVTEPARFDCTPAERLMVAPHDLFFSATDDERRLGDAAIAAERARLGGEAFTSCAEYVDQRYWSHQAFRAYTESFSHDARRVFQLAYAAAPEYIGVAIGSRALLPEYRFGQYPNHMPQLSDPGVSYAMHPRGGAPAPKNEFDALLQPGNEGALAAFLDVGDRAGNPLERDARNRRNAAIRSRLSQLRTYWDLGNGFSDRDGWHWHPRVSGQLRQQGYSDQELFLLHQRRERFLELLTLRRGKAEQLAFALGRAFPDLGLVSRIRGQVQALDDEIEDLLLDADGRNCFVARHDASGRPIASPCDWSPRDFMDDVEALFGEARRRSADRCRALAPADFSTLASGYAYLVPAMPEPVWRSEPNDPTTNVWRFDEYLDRRAQTLRLLSSAFGAGDPARTPLWGQSYGDGDQIGDPEWFAAGWSADFSWAVDVPTGGPGYCGIDARADGSMTAYVILDNDRWNLVDGGLSAGVRGSRFASHLEVLGIDVWDEPPSGGGTALPGFDAATYDFNLVYSQTVASVDEGDSIEVPVFTLAGFDIVVDLGYAARLGVDVGGEIQLWVDDDDGCGPGLDLSLGASVRPFAELDGFAQLGIDFFLAEVGIGGSLRLLDVAAPLSVAISAQTEGPLQSLGRARLSVDVDANIELAAMSGELYVYLETFWDTYRKTIFRWEGDEWTLPLFAKSYSYELQPLLEYCGRPGASCD